MYIYLYFQKCKLFDYVPDMDIFLIHFAFDCVMFYYTYFVHCYI